MAEQNGHDVVNQTLSGGDPSPSDVPASTTDNKSAGGDEGEINITATTSSETNSKVEREGPQTGMVPPTEISDKAKDEEQTTTDTSKQGLGTVATKVLEMNGVTSASDGGEDTASQGGSESDASRTESRLHSRAGSTKRPTTFKPVSFAKFSVPKASGTPPPTKVPEKTPLPSGTTLGTMLQTPRPRLVAKTTSSLRDSLSKMGTSGARLGGGGPDPNQVWNRNRPVQQAPQKHLTDEELKQQYGIHMTSRIQEDGVGTESKWADIDDDEDDWAPETIEWNDGTKTDLTHAEAIPPTTQPTTTQTTAESKEEFPLAEQVTTTKEPTKPIAKPVTSIGPNPTVLRLGANAERQARTASVSSKGPNDKPSSSSTSPAPPAKSPWAAIPPVEKMSPVLPPAQPHVQPATRTPFREQKPNDVPSAPVAPKEIAADDFNRVWRDTQPGTRELFNSRSGRYEPVPETRKGAWRNEQNLRAPSVLQRPPAQGENVGPAEPSAAFQTHRTSAQDGVHWTRRRTSSNVSGGSGSYGRRMSIGRPDAAQRSFETRRGSQVNGMVDSYIHAREQPPHEMQMRDVSPMRHGIGSSYPRRESVNAPEIVPNMVAGPGQSPAPLPASLPAPLPTADGHPMAPQPPQEDPVAMQERIMKEKRLEARQRRIEQEEKEEAAKRERIRQKLEALGPPPDKSKAKSKESPELNRAETAASSLVQSPPKPPVPEPTGAPKQYGMMKVHHPDSVKKLIERERSQEKTIPAPNTRRASSPGRDPKTDSVTANGLQPPNEPLELGGDKIADQMIDEQSPQWRGNLNVPNTYSHWTANSKLVNTSTALTNPWKPLSNDKTLGNGIFDPSLGNFPTRDLALRNHLVLDQPSIPPSSQPFPATSRSAQESATISPLASPETRHASYDALNPISRPGPIGPPRAQHSHWQPEARTAAWNEFHAVATKREAEENEKQRSEMNAVREAQPALQVSFNETWRQVRTGEVVSVSRSTDGNPPIPNPLSSLEHAVGPLPFAETHARPLGSVPIRSSRFFPQATESRKPAYEEADYFRSPSPPPPEEVSTHPVYFGDSNRPLVHLPAPKPIVKLPPKVVIPPPPPPTFASMVASNSRSGPASTVTSWQEKINTLFGKKTTVPEKKNALAVLSASKEPLDVQLHMPAVSVSLPYNGDAQAGEGELTARQVEEAEAMFEDRDLGSLPVVRVPTMAPPAAWRAARVPSQARQRSKVLKTMQVHSVEPFSLGYNKGGSAVTRIRVQFPGAAAPRLVTAPRKAGSYTTSPVTVPSEATPFAISRARGPSMYKPRKNTKQREGTSSSSFKKTASQQPNGGSSSQRQSRKSSWDTPSTSASH
ncbi:hypothetical protein BDW59DRAFT_24184 [Aspergillus cavernicola]|uniref:DUF4045 domain-containing protein n=1 Tax=Aspergillus cavernicola TaxID=176166 RepID=A0ABR4HH20_9EURO